jgi:hypothetical protein
MEFLIANPFFPLACVAVATVIVSLIATIVCKKFGIKFVKSTASIIKFIQNILKEAKVDNANLSNILQLISQAVIYAIALGEDKTIDEKTADAVDFVKNISNQLGFIISDFEMVIIKEACKTAFVYIETLEINVDKLKVNKIEHTSETVADTILQLEMMYK